MASINQQILSVQSDEVQQADVIKHIMYHAQTVFVNREGFLERNIITPRAYALVGLSDCFRPSVCLSVRLSVCP